MLHEDDRPLTDAPEEDRNLALAVLEYLERDGAEGLRMRLERAEDPSVTRSWVSLDDPMPATPAAVKKVFTPEELEQLKAKVGATATPQWVVEHLTQLLPKIVDRLSPLGKLPTDRTLQFQTSELRRKLLR